MKITDNAKHIEHIVSVGLGPATQAILAIIPESDPDRETLAEMATCIALGHFIAALADAGYRLQPPGTILWPENAAQAKVMHLVADKWLEDQG